MKKVFTLLCGLLSFAGTLQAATVEDIALSKHSYVLVGDEVTANGTVKPNVNTLVANKHVLLYGADGQKTVATNKGSVDLSVADGEIVTEELSAKYGAYGSHLNSLRFKQGQDLVVVKLTAQTKIIIFYTGQGNAGAKARYPKICTSAAFEAGLSAKGGDLKNGFNAATGLNAGPTAETPAIGISRFEFTVPDDDVYYIGSYNGDIYVSYFIVEAKEAPGTPAINVGPQTYENGLWFREVTCTARPIVEDGESLPTIVTYTLDGSNPNLNSTRYTTPIKCYNDQVIRFQAYYEDAYDETGICPNADNEAAVTFRFDAPVINVEGAAFTIDCPYEGAQNFYSVAGGDFVAGNGATLTESAVVKAYSQIVNGSYATFTTNPTTTDVYVLNAIKEVKTIAVTGTAEVDTEATETSQNGTVYRLADAAISVDKMDFFARNVEFAVLATADANNAKYQAPAGQEAYIKMNNTRISFLVAEGDSVNVEVTCSKNSCKKIEEAGEGEVDNRKCYVSVLTKGEAKAKDFGGKDLTLNPDGNIVKFGLGAGIHTFTKYGATGNILISSIVITPVDKSGISQMAAESKLSAKKVIRNGQFFIETAKGTFTAAGLRVK